MTNEHKTEGASFAKFLESLSEEQIAEGNRISHEESKAEYERFKECFSSNMCYLCDKPIKTFSEANPCIHWLLKPKGFRNKHIELIGKKFGYFQIQSLLRWYANDESFAKNINDLPEEGTGKLFETTIRYKHLEWSFSCAQSDYLGHENSHKGNFPHYHFQMRVDKRPFINFNRNHMPFSKMDLVNIEAMRTSPELIKQRYPFGEGVSDTLKPDMLETVIKNTVPAVNEEDGEYQINSLLMAEPGKGISGDKIGELIREAKEKGVTVASLLHKIPDANLEISISPGESVVEQAPRSQGKKTHNKKPQ